MESALRTASVVLLVITRDFMRSRYCMEELGWACDELKRQSQPQQRPPGAALPLIIAPIFYHEQDPVVGFGVDAFSEAAIRRQWQHLSTATNAESSQWVKNLLRIKQQTGIRQDSAARYSMSATCYRRAVNMVCH
jgi:hypothetical protein